MSNLVRETFCYKQISATANISPIGAALGGVFCSSSSAATLVIYDSATTTTTTKIIDTLTLVAGQFYPMPFEAYNGIYAVISGTASITVAYTA